MNVESFLGSRFRTFVWGMFLAAGGSAYSAEVTINKGFYRASYEKLSLPDDEVMGLVGVDYLMQNGNGVYYGFGMYGSVYGERGGFFTGGIELGYEHALFDSVLVDLGLFCGGGGGGHAPQGGGLMLRPHAGILYDAGSWKGGIAYSRVEFPNGNIGSSQIALQLEVPFETVSVDAGHNESLYAELKNYTNRYDFGWIDHYFAATLQTYFPLGDVNNVDKNATMGNVVLAGFEYGSYFTEEWFGFFETSGAVTGGVGGYAEVLGGVGYDLALTRKLGLKAKASLGSGGGGGVDTGGGFMYKAALGAYYEPFDSLTLSAETGYVDAPEGSFSAQTAKLSMAYKLTFLGTVNGRREDGNLEAIKSGEWNIRIVNESYLPSDSMRYTGQSSSVQLIGLKVDRYLSDVFYITGQASGAYKGDSGGYAVGLVGPGYRTPRFYDRISFSAEFLGGAGAGGSIDTQGGAVIEPMTGVQYAVSKNTALQIGLGRIMALRGGLNTTVVDIGLVYRFGTIEKR